MAARYGIGSAIAASFAGQGSTLVLVDRDVAGLARLVASLPAAAPIHALPCDLGNDADVVRLAECIGRDCSRVDVLVNNAGAEYPTPLAEDDAGAMSRWSALLQNNVVSMVRLTRSLLPLLAHGASVINQSSIWGHTSVSDLTADSSSKHAEIGLTRSLAFELAPHGIRVNAVCPGWVRTDAVMRSLSTMAAERGVDAATMEREIVARQALPGMLEPSDIAGVFLFLASADAASHTGQSIVASRGEVMH